MAYPFAASRPAGPYSNQVGPTEAQRHQQWGPKLSKCG